jgi:hypothetical protein
MAKLWIEKFQVKEDELYAILILILFPHHRYCVRSSDDGLKSEHPLKTPPTSFTEKNVIKRHISDNSQSKNHNSYKGGQRK